MAQKTNMTTNNIKTKRDELLDNMLKYFTKEEQNNLKECTHEFEKKLNFEKRANTPCVLVAYSGGKDSSYVVAYIRLIQLFLHNQTEHTFKLRVVTYRHTGVPKATMENIHRVYSSLNFYDDPDVEMLLYDEDEVSLFDKDKPTSVFVKNKNKKDILMMGHLTKGDGRPTFCNACNLSYIHSVVLAAGLNGCYADIFITGDSAHEMKDYCLWVRKLAKQLVPKNQKINTDFCGFRGYKSIRKIAKQYYKNIYKDQHEEDVVQNNNAYNDPDCNPELFSIYDYTNYESGDHWDFLTKFLGFQFDDLAFSFTESDCANPALMAHIRALKAEHVHQRNYEDGILDYFQLVIKIMKAKNIPDHLILKSITAYLVDSGMQKMRQRIQSFAEETCGLLEQHFICMVFSPFTQQGLHLELFLKQEYPALCSNLPEFHCLLIGKKRSSKDSKFEKLLIEISGLSLTDLRVLYKSQTSLPAEGKTIINQILQHDPNKMIIDTRHSTHGPIVQELISGR